ncbi:MAG: glycosyltransferase family 4 protein [Balneolaceae bacterium]|nr:glycosyltransferase family 4 protein [Balneolaceae bacterium]
MPDLITVVGIIFIAGCNYVATGWFIKYAQKHNITDVPTKRSSHSTPTPRGGGIGFVLTSIIAFVLYFAWQGLLTSSAYLSLIATTIVISLLGWFDDRINLSQSIRLVTQVAAASLILFFVGTLDSFSLPYVSEFSLGIFSPFLGILWITGVTNIYNFMDGVDGIATAQALTASGGWMIFAFFWGEPTLFTLNLIVFATVLVFLIYNWAPAKIFMGDVGSLFLGFFFAVMPFVAASVSKEITIATSLWIGALLLWPFLFDSSSTLVRRMIKGENIFKPHRSHLYQRLNIAGWPHSKISTLYLAFALICLMISLLYYHENDAVQISLLLLLLLMSFLYLTGVHFVEKNKQQ